MPQLQGFVSKHRTGATLGTLLLVSFLLLSFSSGSVVLKPKQVGLAIFSVFDNSATQIGGFFARTVTSVSELQRLQVKYQALEKQLGEYETIERDVVELREENKILKQQLGFAKTLSYVNIPAEVIGNDPSNITSTIIINKGSRQGIHKDMPVVAFQDGFQGLVGKTLVVSADSSIVLPILDPNCYVSARLQRSRYEGLVSGVGTAEGDVEMSYVPKSARDVIQYGDLVITAGLNSIYPKGIYIGRVRSISAKNWETTLDLRIQPIINFSRLEYVFVVKKALEPSGGSANEDAAKAPPSGEARPSPAPGASGSSGSGG